MQTRPCPTPESEALRRETAALRDELARLIAERAQMLEVEGPLLEARWCVLLGDLQLRVLEAECDVRRLRRKLDLIRVELNCGAVPEIAAVEARLEAEMEDWRAMVREEARRLQAARSWVGARPLPPEEARELRSIFREVARRCHPDTNPGGGTAAEALWLRASDAYAHGDLEELRALALLLPEIAEEAPATDGLRERRDALRASVARLLEDVRALAGHYPFTLRARLEDAEGIERERRDLLARQAALADESILLELAVAATMREVQDG
jgi:hypothetical protein